MGFFQNLGSGQMFEGIGKGLGAVLQGAGGLVSSALGGATNLINSPGGAAGLGAVAGIFGGPAGIALSSFGGGAQNASKKGPGWTEPLSGSSKLFSLHQIDANGLYVRGSDGDRQISFVKVFLVVILPCGILLYLLKRFKVF